MKIVNDPLENGIKKCTSDYKTRNTKRPTHNGMDLISKSSKNNYIIAIEDGEVSYAGYDSSAGYYVYVLHQNGYKSFYCHLVKDSILVKKGQKVKKRDRLGLMGMTGTATGVHLHFGLKNEKKVWIDPLPLIEGKIILKNWDKGIYKPLKDKYVRKTPEVSSNNKMKYSVLNQAMKNICTKDTSGYAKFKRGCKIELSEFKTDKKGYVWGKRKGVNTDTWICVYDSTGYQVEKI